LLIAEGFPWHIVWALPLATLWTEAGIARERINDRMATEAILLQTAVVDVIGGGDHLSGVLEILRDE
jgi:hypothetical protein